MYVCMYVFVQHLCSMSASLVEHLDSRSIDLLPESSDVLAANVARCSKRCHSRLVGEVGLFVAGPERTVGPVRQVRQFIVRVVHIRGECPTGHAKRRLASLRVQEVDAHLVGDEALRALVLVLQLLLGVVAERAEPGGASLGGALLPAGRLPGQAGLVVGHLAAHLVLVLGDLASGHPEAGHAGLVGEAVGAHLQVNESLGFAVLLLRLAHVHNSRHSDAGHARL